MSKQIRHIKEAKQRQKKRRRRRQIRLAVRIVIPCLLCIGIFFGVRGIVRRVVSFFHKSSAQTEETAKKPSGDSIDTSHVEIKNLVIHTDAEKNSNGAVSVTVSSIGDCTLGTDEHFNQTRSLNAYYNNYGADYFFQHVRPVLEADDLSIVNMEGTFTEETARANKKYAFKGPPEYVSILTGSSVEAANLANNHSQDYGEQSYQDTVRTLEEAGITSFGNENAAILEIKGVKVGLTGIYELAEHLGKETQVKENIAALKEAGAQIIIVNFHWGIERQYVPTDVQKQLAHLAIDEGADLVIGHHPHVLQGIEKYNGKYIAYSLGNFCFGGNSNPSDKDTLIFQQTFTITKDGLKEDDKITLIPCSLSSTTGKNDYCPVPLEGAEKERVLEKIQKYSEGL